MPRNVLPKINYCKNFALCYDGVGCSVRDFDLAFFTYLLECSNDSLYAGWTVDLCKRIEQHNAGKGAKYTRALRPVRLKASWNFLLKRKQCRLNGISSNCLVRKN